MQLYQRFLPYGVAIGATAIALLLTLCLEPLLSRTIGAFFYIAIIFSIWYGGFRPGMVAVVLSTLAINYFFITPLNQLPINQLEDVLRLAIFSLVAFVINIITSSIQESKQKIQRLNQQLTQENAEQLRMALAAAQMGMWDWNLVTGEIKCSPEYEQLFGLLPGTFDGKYETFNACLHPDDREGLNQALVRSRQERIPYQQEFRVIWADGSIHWIEGRGKAFYDATGQPVRMTGTIMAIDDRKQAEELLQQQFQQQRLVMDITQRIRQSLNLPEILQTTVDEVRQFLNCDRVIIYQFSPSWGGTVVVESVTNQWMQIFPLQIYDPCIGEEYFAHFKQCLFLTKSDIYNSAISPCHIELLAQFQVRGNLVVPIIQEDQLWGLLAAHHCAAPRQWQDVEIELLRQIATQLSIALQQSALLEQVQTELDERKQAEIALHESQIQLQRQLAEIETIYQSAPIGLNVLDTELRFVRINQRLAEINGLPVAAHIGHTIRELLPELADTAEQLLYSILETGKPLLNVEINGKTPAQPGVKRTWLESFLPLKDGDQIIGISTVCEEITERKQAEIALQQLNAELEQRVAQRTAELTAVNDRLLETVMEQQYTQMILLEQAQLLDLAHDTILTRDLNSVITFWNQGAESMYGWKKAEALGQEIHTLLQTKFLQPLAEIESELLAIGYWKGELIHTRRNGSKITVASRWVMQKDQMGRPVKVLEINNDITIQKQNQAALQQYLSEIEDLYNNAPCGYHSLDAEGKFIRINNTELNWLGYSRDEILHQKFYDFVTAESKQVFLKKFPKFKQQGWINNLEFEMIHKDGTTRWLSLNATAIKNAAGNFVSSRSTLFDISDRKRAEAERKQAELALQESEERRRLALDLTHIGFWDWHLPSNTLIWNDNHFMLLGLTLNELEANYQLWRSHVHPDDLDWVEKQFLESIKSRTDYIAEYRVVHPDGSVHWLMGRAKAIYDESGQPVRSLGVLLDISDRKRIEQALQQSEEQFRQLAENIQAVFWIRDIQTDQLLYISSAYETIWQRSCVSLYQNYSSWLEAIHPEDRQRMKTVILELKTTGQYHEKYRIIGADGTIRWICDRAFPIKNETGELVRIAGIAEDITEQQNIEQIKSEFISIVSHELRTPLTAIKMSLGLLNTGIYDHKPDKFKRMLEIALIDSNRLVNLVNDILDLERLESGRTFLEKTPCRAVDLIQQAVNGVQALATPQQITINIAATDLQVWASPDAIIQTLTNLLSNALKFSPPNSTITLSTEYQKLPSKVVNHISKNSPRPPVTSSPPLLDRGVGEVGGEKASSWNRTQYQSQPPNDYVLFRVSDQGRGIPADKLEAIFGRFQQVDASDARQKGGTGLGLAICRSIIEQHGGKIWVESTLGAGSTFFFTLPLPPEVIP